jgi:hypothetical protein
VIERDALMFPDHRNASTAEARGIINRVEDAPGTVEQNGPHAAGELTRGVKDLLARSR